MSKIDPEVLYLILTKVAGRQSFYNYDVAQLPSGQAPGTITHRQLSEIYERITGNRMSVRTNWNLPLGQLNALLALCSLPSFSPLLLTSAEAGAGSQGAVSSELKRVHDQKWPPFSALKGLYRRG
jgi:hypothetical protein